MSRPGTKDFHSADDTEIERLHAKGLLTRDEARKLLISYEMNSVIMLSADYENLCVFAEILPEHLAIKKYGKLKVLGP